jgi:hypothetical protein
MKQPRMTRILVAAFKGLEVADAKKPLLLFPTQEDFDTATRMDPMHCGFANCVHRSCGSTQAHFFKHYVYIDHFGDDGKRRVYRYCISKNVLDTLASFDRGQKVRVKRAFVLRAPAPSETMHAQRAFNKKWRNSDTAKALNAETKARAELRRSERELEQAVTIAKKIDAPSDSTKAKDVQRRVISAKTQLSKARDAVDTAVKRVKTLRKATYGTGKAKPRALDLTVRSGTGAWLKTIVPSTHAAR